MRLIEHEFIHLFLSLAVGFALWAVYKDKRLIIVSLISGVLIDVDHWIDYFLYFGFNFNLKNFLDVSNYMVPAKKIYVLLHGWEYLPILFWVGSRWGRKIKLNGLPWAIVLPYGLHLIVDNLNVWRSPLVYSFLYRLFNSFNRGVFE